MIEYCFLAMWISILDGKIDIDSMSIFKTYDAAEAYVKRNTGPSRWSQYGWTIRQMEIRDQ